MLKPEYTSRFKKDLKSVEKRQLDVEYLIFISEEFIKMPIMLFRIKQGKWLKNLTVEKM